MWHVPISKTIWFTSCGQFFNVLLAVAAPGFFRWGGTNSKRGASTYSLAHCSRNLHKMKNIGLGLREVALNHFKSLSNVLVGCRRATRMHSSRMRTTHSLTVCHSRSICWRVCVSCMPPCQACSPTMHAHLPYMPPPTIHPPATHTPPPSHTCPPKPRIPPMHAHHPGHAQPPLWTESQTPVKI